MFYNVFFYIQTVVGLGISEPVAVVKQFSFYKAFDSKWTKFLTSVLAVAVSRQEIHHLKMYTPEI